MNLQAIRIVLVGTTHPGNIGASARAMKTMGLSRLALVNPLSYPSAEATARASGADDVLYRAEVFADLDSALAGCHLVIGASARRRGISCVELDPRDCARRVLATTQQHGQVALMLGREHSGLTNEELDRCHFMVRIPANPDYSSLNLAAAVQVLSYELRMTALAGENLADDEEETLPATVDEMERFYMHLQEVLLAYDFLDPANPRHLMRRLRRLFSRALPNQNEINILRGILSAVQNVKRN